MLRGGLTWREFADISKSAFVEVASSDYGIGGRPTNVSRTSILTGLTRREVKRQRELLAEQLDESLTRKTNNATRVLARWHQDPDFSDGEGNARELHYEDGEYSFTELLRRYAGDIPPKAMLKELVTTGAVEETKDGRLRAIRRPSLVIHGTDDPLVPVEGGMDTAEHIPDARLELIPGMGHNLPEGLYDQLADLITTHARKAI